MRTVLRHPRYYPHLSATLIRSSAYFLFASPTHPVNGTVITPEINRTLELYININVSLEKLRFGDAITELLRVIRSHGLRLPGQLVLLFKALAMSEAFCKLSLPKRALQIII